MVVEKKLYLETNQAVLIGSSCTKKDLDRKEGRRRWHGGRSILIFQTSIPLWSSIVIGHRLVYCAARLLQIAEPCRHMETRAGYPTEQHALHAFRKVLLRFVCGVQGWDSVPYRRIISAWKFRSFARPKLGGLLRAYVAFEVAALQLGFMVANHTCWASWKANSRPSRAVVVHSLANLGGSSAVYKKKPK